MVFSTLVYGGSNCECYIAKAALNGTSKQEVRLFIKTRFMKVAEGSDIR